MNLLIVLAPLPRTAVKHSQSSCSKEASSQNHTENAVMTALHETTSILKGLTRNCLILTAVFIKNLKRWDFPGGPVGENLPCDAGNVGWIPGWGTKIPHAMEKLRL